MTTNIEKCGAVIELSTADRIEELKREVLEDKESFGGVFREMTVDYAIRQGTRFKELKELVGAGKWRPFLKREKIGINPRTCELYIEIAANKDDAIAYPPRRPPLP